MKKSFKCQIIILIQHIIFFATDRQYYCNKCKLFLQADHRLPPTPRVRGSRRPALEQRRPLRRETYA